MPFRKLGIAESILKVIEEEKFEKPSEIQAKSIPLVLQGKDVIGGSATGSGKTLAFGAGIIQNCVKGKGIQALVLTPTRELAEQITQSLKKFSKYQPLNIISVYGGVSINPQMDGLRHADVVVGTPGRILDHLERQTIDLSKIKILVLDEADRMLDMGFIEDVEKIISQCKKDRQTLLFSATIPPRITDLVNKFMKHPKEVSADSYVDPKLLSQVYYNVSDNLKFSLLVHLLKEEHEGLVMVFCNTQKNTDFVERNLRKLGVDAMAIHGGFSQQRRNQALEKFNSNRLFVLVCTDVAARGLDIKGVTHVYNYDIPKESKQYIHRIGRTARAGENGRAINILTQRDHDNFRRVLQDFDVDPKQMEVPKIEKARISWKPDQRGGSRGFGRGSRGEFGASRRRPGAGYQRAGGGSPRPRTQSRGPRTGFRGKGRDQGSFQKKRGFSSRGRANSQRR